MNPVGGGVGQKNFILYGHKRMMANYHILCVLAMFVLGISKTTHAYIPGVNHRSIAGLWKLVPKKKTPVQKQQYPLKEFTVYPKKSSTTVMTTTAQQEAAKEILLMLKEDGSFQQYDDDTDEEDDDDEVKSKNQQVKIPDKLTFHKDDGAILETAFFGRFQGKWDYLDGKLILAADRPENNPKVEDTLLVGEVVAKKEQSLEDNPMVQNTTKETIKPSQFDTHLSVPKGKVNVGKFFYPKKHPSFFEQPMFSPTTKGKFELKQVLGSLNAQNPDQDEGQLIEKFRQKDFHGKRFLLTSSPLGRYRPKGNIRWSIKYNKFVEDPPTRKAKKQAEEEENRPANIRVMEVQFFANNTFATVGGLGESILRGKYHIVGHDRDQLWMQIWRFGFGRDVSGSVYSEGKSLTKEDEKTYWGTIKYEDEKTADDKTTSDTSDSTKNSPSLPKDTTSELEGGDAATNDDDINNNEDRRLIVKGSVIYGYGLEPQPVGRFVMTESSEEELDHDEEEDDDDDDNIDSLNTLIEISSDDGEDEFSDWSNAFQ